LQGLRAYSTIRINPNSGLKPLSGSTRATIDGGIKDAVINPIGKFIAFIFFPILGFVLWAKVFRV